MMSMELLSECGDNNKNVDRQSESSMMTELQHMLIIKNIIVSV